MFGIFKKKCETCRNSDPEIFMAFQITKMSKRSHTHTTGGMHIVDSLDGFDTAFSDTGRTNPVGNLYMYKMGADLGKHLFCSLKCAFDFSKKQNALVMYMNPDNPRQMLAIIPELVDINIAMGNPESMKYVGRPAGNLK